MTEQEKDNEIKFEAPEYNPVSKMLMIATENAKNPDAIACLAKFLKESGVTKVGVAYCKSMQDPALKFVETLKECGFDVASISCKASERTFEDLGIEVSEDKKKEIACDPLYQSCWLVEKEQVHVVITFGLCYGHQFLIQKACPRMVIPFCIKDASTNHLPLERFGCVSRK